MKKSLATIMFFVACGPPSVRPAQIMGDSTDGATPTQNNGDDGGFIESENDGGAPGCGQDCYTVYAHSDNVLYRIDLSQKTLLEVGPFNAPKVGGSADIITDLAVSPTDQVYAISNTNLYTASATDGHVTLIGPITACGTDGVALTFSVDGNLYTADYKGAFCHIDLTTSPPTVTQLGTLGGGLAIAGDLVAVSDGTMYGTAYLLNQTATENNNILVKIDPSTGQATQQIGATGYPKLFGISYALGQVFGFTHDGSGNVITIDPKTGQGALFNSFKTPGTSTGISFAGAGVNSMVPPTIN